MRIQESNKGYPKITIMDDVAKNLQKSENLFKLNKSLFRHMGSGQLANGQSFKKSPFKNIK
jgi:hypothetical protein